MITIFENKQEASQYQFRPYHFKSRFIAVKNGDKYDIIKSHYGEKQNGIDEKTLFQEIQNTITPESQTKLFHASESTQKYIPDLDDNLKKLYGEYYEVGHWTADNWKIHINNMSVLGTAIMNSGGNPFMIMQKNENFMKTLASNHIEIKQTNYLKLGEHPE